MQLLPLTRAALPVLALLAPSMAGADTLDVQVTADVAIPAENVKAAIAAELGTSIDGGGKDLGALAIALDGEGRLVVAHQRADGTSLVRTVALPQLPADRLALIAFVTGNLVRDQLADLPADESVAAPGLVAPPTVVAPTVIAASREEAEVTVPVSIGLIPPLSTDRLFTSRARVRGALNLIVGASSSVDGISVSGAADLSANVRGLQIGGAASIARDLRGLQAGGAVTIARDTVGIQLAGAGAVARELRGVQAAGAATIARDTAGIQIAGGGAVSRDVHGLQVAGGAAVARRIEGAQIASFSIAGEVHGLQIGAVNVTGRVHGLQLGAINISDESDGAQIGALNFVRHGRTDIDAWAESNGLAAIGLRHGGRYVHNVYAVGVTPDGGKTPLLGLGIGVHRPLGGMTLDLDAMAWQTHMFDDGIGLLTQARATLALDLGPVAGFVAAAYNVSIEDHADMRPLKTTFARTIGDPMSSVDVALWPSLAVGVRGHFGALR